MIQSQCSLSFQFGHASPLCFSMLFISIDEKPFQKTKLEKGNCHIVTSFTNIEFYKKRNLV